MMSAPSTFAARPGPYPMGLMAVLATVTMLFAAFTAAMLIRRTGPDWARVPVPPVAWANLGVLAASSLALEAARRRARRPWAAIALGFVFVGGQLMVWQTLAARGIFLPTNPHASFLYMLSALHALHVLGGLAALAWTARRPASLAHAAIYWHFVGIVWLYLLILLSTL